MVTLQGPTDRVENQPEDKDHTLDEAEQVAAFRDAFRVSYPGLDPWWKRRWSLPKVEARGKGWRNRFRWAMAIGADTPVEEGGIARWELAILAKLLDLSQANGRAVHHRTHRRLAMDLGVTPRSVKRWLDGLRARGWVEWCHNMDKNSRGQIRQLPNTYLLLVPGWVAGAIDRTANGATTAAPVPDPAAGVEGAAEAREPSVAEVVAESDRRRVEGLTAAATGLPDTPVAGDVDASVRAGEWTAAAEPAAVRRRRASSRVAAIKQANGMGDQGGAQGDTVDIVVGEGRPPP